MGSGGDSNPPKVGGGEQGGKWEVLFEAPLEPRYSRRTSFGVPNFGTLGFSLFMASKIWYNEIIPLYQM